MGFWRLDMQGKPFEFPTCVLDKKRVCQNNK